MISVNNLTKIYKIPKKQDSVAGFFKDLLKREYKEIKALDQISFEIGRGELVGFIGPNGAGKTSTMKILSGILYPTSGTATVQGYTPFEKKHEFLRRIAFVMGQKNQLIWDLPAYDSFLLSKEIYEVSDEQFKKTVDELSSLLDCGQLIHHHVRSLSLGERMKMELIAAVLHRPSVLFLDEPTIGLDVVAQKIIRDFIRNYQKLYHATIMLTSHYMEDVKQLAKRIIIINHGAIMYDGGLEEVVRKYAEEKVITVILEDTPAESVLKNIQNEYELTGPKVIFKVKRNDLARVVELISKNLAFEDLTIEEERIEDVIRKMFVEK